MITQRRGWVDYLLWLLLAIGFLGAVKVSFDNMTGSPCPHIMTIPICYLVLAGYTLMVMSVIIYHKGCRHYFFTTGWSVAAAIALIGTVAEVVAGGGVCPTSGGGSLRGAANSGSIPLCYVSLALLIGILVLFLMGPYKRTCAVANRHDGAGSDAGTPGQSA